MTSRFVLALLAALLCRPVLAAMPGVPANGQLAFTVTRNGDPIGRLTYRFESQGSRQVVRIETRILYKLLNIPFYRFDQDITEEWVDGRLLSLVSKTDDDGKPFDLSAHADGPDMRIALNGKSEVLADTNLPASLWNPATYRASKLFDTQDGKLFDVTGKQEDGHVVISGTFNRQVWYDAKGELTDVRFTARDGSFIRYVRD